MGQPVFEPIVSLTTNCFVGAEAVLPGSLPRRGSEGIGTSALRDACRRAAEWNDADSGAPIVVSANASAEQFRDGFAAAVRAAVTDAGADPASVCVELTEQTLMVDLDATMRTLDELRSIGISVTIDHFGSGYSSLDSLTRMAVDAIKIPPSFISGSATNDDAMVASVIGLAHAMELGVIVEGVETAGQLARLRDLGCDAAQGPWVGAPLTADEMTRRVAAARAGRTLAAGPWGHRGSTATVNHEQTARADPALLEMLQATCDRGRHGTVAELGSLSPRQLDIVRRLLQGDRVPTIARDLYVSASTVRNHLSKAFGKLGVHSQDELLALLRSLRVAHENALAAGEAARPGTSDR